MWLSAQENFIECYATSTGKELLITSYSIMRTQLSAMPLRIVTSFYTRYNDILTNYNHRKFSSKQFLDYVNNFHPNFHNLHQHTKRIPISTFQISSSVETYTTLKQMPLQKPHQLALSFTSTPVIPQNISWQLSVSLKQNAPLALEPPPNKHKEQHAILYTGEGKEEEEKKKQFSLPSTL